MTQTKNVVPKVEKKAAAKTLVSVITEVGAKGAQNREQLAKAVFAHCQKIGMKQNSKGNTIKLEKVLTLINAFSRDIKNERPGKWSKLKVVEDEKQFKIIAKA